METKQRQRPTPIMAEKNLERKDPTRYHWVVQQQREIIIVETAWEGIDVDTSRYQYQ